MKTMYLDRKKAKAIIKRELKKKNFESADLVLAGDESWNCEAIFRHGEFYEQKDFKCHECSYWATPTLVIHYGKGLQKRIDCYYEKEEEDL